MTDKLTTLGPGTLVLASASPRRAELLTAAGITYVIHPADIDESRRPNERPEDYVLRLSREKALAVGRVSPPERVILGADTVVLIGSEVAGKPTDAADAERMLRLLSGTWHEVLTGVTLVAGEDFRSEISRTRVRFVSLSDREIAWYLASDEPFDKAGAYAIQGFASLFIEEIEGSYSNVVGLPMQTVYRLASEMGIDLLDHTNEA